MGPPYTYDAAGNMTHDASHGYFYDAENRIIQVDGTQGTCSSASACYVYDPVSGKRAEKLIGTATTSYDRDLSGNVIAEWGPGCGSSCWTIVYAYLNGRLLAEYQNETTYFVHEDHLGSTRLVTEVNQSIYDSMDYLPFGELASGGASTTHKFTGKERDPETASAPGLLNGLDNFEARYNSSSLGRFMSPDPMSFMNHKMIDPQQWNMYSYARNNPLRMVDSNGMWPTEIHDQIIDRAFPGLSNHQREVLKAASYHMDYCLTC
jgi:RHS repeat-associated protein